MEYDVKSIRRRLLSSQNLLTIMGTLPQNKSDPYNLSCGASNISIDWLFFSSINWPSDTLGSKQRKGFLNFTL